MRPLLVMLLSLLAACAARQTPPPSARALAQIQQAQAMRRAPQTARQQRALAAGCGLATSVRSMTDSSFCLSCHDGVDASAIVSHSHPIAVRYDSNSSRTALRFPTADGIVLVGGVNVECTSCHDPASKLPSSTALTLDRSTLCLGCHVH